VKLNQNELTRDLFDVNDIDPARSTAAAERIRAHITALESELAALEMESATHLEWMKEERARAEAAEKELAAVTAKLDEWRVAPGSMLDRVCEARNGPRDVGSEAEAVPVPSDLVQGLMARALPAMERAAARLEADLTQFRDADRASMEELAHALGWKDGGPGWQAAIDEVKRLAALKHSGQTAEDKRCVERWIATCTRDHAPYAALSRLATDAQTLQNLRATRWKCQCGRPVNIAGIIDAEKENPT